MCNCGNKTQQRATSVAVALPESYTSRLSRTESVEFEYIGLTAMTVRGPFSGSRYRFHYPGARLRVHERDASSLAAIPNLQLVPSSKV